MKKILFLLLASHTLGVVAADKENTTSTKAKKVGGMPALVYYREVYPKTPLNITASSDRVCKGSQLRFRDFESEVNMVDVDTEEKVPVRVVNVHVRMPKRCKGESAQLNQASYELYADPKRMTHVYVITNPNVQVDFSN